MICFCSELPTAYAPVRSSLHISKLNPLKLHRAIKKALNFLLWEQDCRATVKESGLQHRAVSKQLKGWREPPQAVWKWWISQGKGQQDVWVGRADVQTAFFSSHRIFFTPKHADKIEERDTFFKPRQLVEDLCSISNSSEKETKRIYKEWDEDKCKKRSQCCKMNEWAGLLEQHAQCGLPDKRLLNKQKFFRRE